MAATLVIDTIGPWCAAAIKSQGRIYQDARDIGRGHAEHLAPMVEALLGEADLRPDMLSRIGVNTGPGGFAGTRVGVAFARGLALATGARALGVGALAALARQADPSRSVTVLAVHDAKRGEVLWQVFEKGDPIADIARGDVEAARAACAKHTGARVVGSGAGLVVLDAPTFNARPPLEALIALTDEAGETEPAPAPIYARAPDAKLAGS